MYDSFNKDAPLSVELTRFYPLFVTPVYYGMLMFNIAKSGSKPTIYEVPTTDKLIKIWVCINPDAGNSYSVVVINKYDSSSSRAPVNVTIKTPSTSKFAKMMSMKNPSGLSGLTNTTIAGVDFNDPSTEYKASILSINALSVSVTVSPASAMLVRISDSEQALFFSDDSVVAPVTGFTTPDLNDPIIRNGGKSSGEKNSPMILSAVIVLLVVGISFF